MSKSRRSIVLVAVLLVLTLVAVLVAPLAAVSATASIEAADRARALRHRLAGDSVISALPALLEQDRRLSRDLDRENRAVIAVMVGETQVTAAIQDDGAKLSLPLLF